MHAYIHPKAIFGLSGHSARLSPEKKAHVESIDHVYATPPSRIEGEQGEGEETTRQNRARESREEDNE
jgi:hypothetical protein